MVRGLVGLLADFFNNATPLEITTSDADPLELLDLKRGLTPTRRNGLAAVSAAIHAFAKSQLKSDKSADHVKSSPTRIPHP